MGVRRAVDLAIDNADRYPTGVRTLGPLIHNKQTVELLRDRGVIEIDPAAPSSPLAPLLIRAHGVPPYQQKNYENAGYMIIDGTCPKVKTVHKVIEKYKNLGFEIIVTGDTGHAEVIGLMGYAGEHGHLISTVEEVNDLEDFKQICLVSQTTFDRTIFDSIAEAVNRRFAGREVVIKKTICAATDQRQEETADLAGRVDAMIVVGGRNSANTQRLASVAAQWTKTVVAVETEDEIDWEAIKECRTVGITAGASTPNWVIGRVVDYLQFMAQKQERTFKSRIKQLVDFLSNLNFFAATGAVAVYYLSCFFQGYRWSLDGAILAFLYFLSMYLWNSLASVESTQHLSISRYRFYHAHRFGLFVLAGSSIISLVAISSMQNISLLYLMLFATAIGSLYHIPLAPASLKKIFHYSSIKDIPTSRDLIVALAWATLLTFIPQAAANVLHLTIDTIFCFIWIFLLAYLRSLVFDLRDIEGDRIMGRETLVTIIGEKRVHKAVDILALCAALLLVGYPWIAGVVHGRITPHNFAWWSQLVTVVYVIVFMRISTRIKARYASLFAFLADMFFYVAGICAFAVKLAGL